MKEETVEKILKLLIEEKSIIKVLTTLEKDECYSNHSDSKESMFKRGFKSLSASNDIAIWVN